jgi:hypothetical protein
MHAEQDVNTPAATVSPFLRINIRPMSLFVANVSSGIPRAIEEIPPTRALRNAICASAVVPFVRTLHSL